MPLIKTIGIDLDNTIISYDRAFYTVALKKKLIPNTVNKNKKSVKNYLQKKNMENEWIRLQGEVYGNEISSADMFRGFLECAQTIKKSNLKAYIISHRTKYPYLGRKINLHKKALDWIKSSGIIEKTSIKSKNIFFLETKEEKINKIKELKCDIFVDDLENILLLLPKSIIKIHFDNFYEKNKIDKIIKIKNWKQINIFIKNLLKKNEH